MTEPEALDWRHSVTVGLRDHLVKKMLQAALVINDSNNPVSVANSEQILSKLRAVENRSYELADSRSEYYHLIALKIYNIQKFIHEYKEKMSIPHETDESQHSLEDQIENIGTMIEKMILS